MIAFQSSEIPTRVPQKSQETNNQSLVQEKTLPRPPAIRRILRRLERSGEPCEFYHSRHAQAPEDGWFCQVC